MQKQMIDPIDEEQREDDDDGDDEDSGVESPIPIKKGKKSLQQKSSLSKTAHWNQSSGAASDMGSAPIAQNQNTVYGMRRGDDGSERAAVYDRASKGQQDGDEIDDEYNGTERAEDDISEQGSNGEAEEEEEEKEEDEDDEDRNADMEGQEDENYNAEVEGDMEDDDDEDDDGEDGEEPEEELS